MFFIVLIPPSRDFPKTVPTVRSIHRYVVVGHYVLDSQIGLVSLRALSASLLLPLRSACHFNSLLHITVHSFCNTIQKNLTLNSVGIARESDPNSVKSGLFV